MSLDELNYTETHWNHEIGVNERLDKLRFIGLFGTHAKPKN
jgi:hypothetical protein